MGASEITPDIEALEFNEWVGKFLLLGVFYYLLLIISRVIPNLRYQGLKLWSWFCHVYTSALVFEKAQAWSSKPIV